MAPTPDTSAALAFLRRFSPDGPWILTSIVPDGATTTATFTVAKADDAARWIDQRQGKENIYFSVNPTTRPVFKKTSKEDITRMSWLHVDVDPRVGEDFAEERIRILSVLEKYKIPPTVIVDSGGGCQGFWRLQPEEKLETGGKLAKIQDLERYNIQLSNEFGGDHCHNIDRIMRVPGTINIPDSRKLKKGRVPTLAKVVAWSDAVYPISAFVAAPVVQSPNGDLGNGRPDVKLPGNIPVVDVEALQEWARKNNKTISDHCYALIATGGDPIDPGKYPSRSEALFRVICELIRAEVPDEMIFAVITGPNEIAASVRDKKNSERYALRQIQNAKEAAISPELHRLNQKHAVISDIGGKCRIISEVYDAALDRKRISKQSFEDFRNRYRNTQVTVGSSKDGKPITKPLGNFWIDHPNRRQYETIVFSPGQEVDDAYNLWQGFAVSPMPGDKHQRYLDHIRDNICDGNEEHYKYLISWMAHTVQHPNQPGEVAVVLRGDRGSGKGHFATEFGRLWGRHFIQLSHTKHLVGNFNAHLRDACVVFGDEAFFAGDKQNEGVLKTLITEKISMYEQKGVDVEQAPNYIHLIMASNESWVIPAGEHERRFFVLDVGSKKRQDSSYFGPMLADLNSGGRENLLYFLLSVDLKNFSMRDFPRTDALRDQQEQSMSNEKAWWKTCLEEGRLLRRHTRWQTTVPVDQLYADYLDHMRDLKITHPRHKVSFGRLLTSLIPVPKGTQIKVRRNVEFIEFNRETGFETTVRRDAYVYQIPSLEQCRAHWDEKNGGARIWPAIEDGGQGEIAAASAF